MLKYIFFDLDGTLTDPGIGITNSVMYALNKFGIDVADRTSLYNFIGPPLLYSFQTFYGFSEADSAKAVQYYREYFRVTGLYENEVYAGIPELLTELKSRGYKLVLATSKPEEFAVEILKHFNLYDYFDFAAGATMDSTRSKKADVIRLWSVTGNTIFSVPKKPDLPPSVYYTATETGQSLRPPVQTISQQHLPIF